MPLISVEDRRFFSHWGIDLHRILGAVLENVKRRDPTAQGASTLTQQLARNLYRKVGTQRSSESVGDLLATYARKIREQITAVHVERLYTKREILVMYLNTVFFGYDAYGLKSAARLYFDKEAGELEVEECAMLAGLLKAPNSYSPFNHPEKALGRRNLVLEEMVKAGKLDAEEAERLSREPARIRRGRRSETYGLAPYFVEFVRQQLDAEHGGKLYREGYSVHTTLDATLQRIAEEHFNTQIAAVQAKVDAWVARQAPAHRPDSDRAVVQGAFIAIDPATGDILAMIGGRDFSESKFNRAHQALRQAGSAFKPFVYTAAIDNNRFPIDVYDDNSIVVEEWDGTIWTPENYDHKFKGPVTLRQGLKESRNIIALKLAQDLGPDRVAQYAETMGISTPIDPYYAIGIGSSDVRLLDMVAAYSVFPNRGIYVRPVPVSRIEDSEGSVIFESSPGAARGAASGRGRGHDRPDALGDGRVRRHRPLGSLPPRLPLGGGRQDGYHQRLPRRLVPRLHAPPGGRRLGRCRRSQHRTGLPGRRRRRPAGLGPLHEAGLRRGRALPRAAAATGRVPGGAGGVPLRVHGHVQAGDALLSEPVEGARPRRDQTPAGGSRDLHPRRRHAGAMPPPRRRLRRTAAAAVLSRRSQGAKKMNSRPPRSPRTGRAPGSGGPPRPVTGGIRRRSSASRPAGRRPGP